MIQSLNEFETHRKARSRLPRQSRWALLWMALALIPIAAADDARSQLDRYFETVRTLDGAFQQAVYDETGELVQESSGRVSLLRPNRFRWQYLQPYPQLIVADGKHLWIYDEELQQATVKPMDEALATAPIVLLSESGRLEEQFDVTKTARRDGMDWLELVPRVKDSEFVRIDFALQDGNVRRMDLIDQFGQRTEIRFLNLVTNRPAKPDAYRFDAPPGVDVIGTVE